MRAVVGAAVDAIITIDANGAIATFNAAACFVDRHIEEGRGGKVAIECGDERITYGQLLERVNRFGTALRDRLGVRPEERVLLLLLDEPAFPYAFFCTMKIGAIAVPANTLLKEKDYRYLLSDTRASVLVELGAYREALALVSDKRFRLETRRTRATVQATLALALAGLGDTDAAATALRQGAELDPSNPHLCRARQRVARMPHSRQQEIVADVPAG